MLDRAKIEWSIWQDTFQLMRKYYDITNNVDQWDKLCDSAAELCKKYKDNDFCKDIVIAVLGQLERRASDQQILTSEKGV